jgi:hypothetical protein
VTSLYGGRVETRSLDAWRHSHLAELPDEVRTAMLADAFVMTAPAGTPIGEPGNGAVLVLIHSGLSRIVLEGPDGRIPLACWCQPTAPRPAAVSA